MLTKSNPLGAGGARLPPPALSTHATASGLPPAGDWSVDAANPADAPVWGADLLGGATPGGCIPSGPFADLRRTYPGPRCTWRGFTAAPGGGANSMDGRTFENSATLQAAIAADTPYDSFRRAVEAAHGDPHVLIGAARLDLFESRPAFTGDMRLPRTSPNDPVFYLHHAYVDSLWARRQALPGRAAEYGGRAGEAPTDVLLPFAPATVADTFRLPCVRYVPRRLPPQPTTAPGTGPRALPRSRPAVEAAVAAERAPRAAAQAAFAASTGQSAAAVAEAQAELAEAATQAVLDGAPFPLPPPPALTVRAGAPPAAGVGGGGGAA